MPVSLIVDVTICEAGSQWSEVELRMKSGKGNTWKKRLRICKASREWKILHDKELCLTEWNRFGD